MTRRKSAKEKANISKGLQAYWDKKGTKKKTALSAGALGLVAGGVLAAKKGNFKKLNQKIEKGIEKKAAKIVKKAVLSKGPPKPKVQAAIRGAKQGLLEGSKEKTKQKLSSAAREVKVESVEGIKDILETPKKTAGAFKEGYKNPGTGKSAKTGKTLAKLYKRSKKDIKKSREFLGFNNPQEQFWIEFERKKTSGKKALSAQHRAAISKGLQEHYASLPPKQETKADKFEKVSRSINRLSNAANSAANAGAAGIAIYDAIQSRKKKNFGAKIMQGIDALDSVTQSVGRVGNTASALANAASTINDVKNNRKGKELTLKSANLALKKDQLKTKRQSAAVNAKLTRKKLKNQSTSTRSYANLVSVQIPKNRELKYKELQERIKKRTGK